MEIWYLASKIFIFAVYGLWVPVHYDRSSNFPLFLKRLSKLCVYATELLWVWNVTKNDLDLFFGISNYTTSCIFQY